MLFQKHAGPLAHILPGEDMSQTPEATVQRIVIQGQRTEPGIDCRAVHTAVSLEIVQILKSWMCLLFISAGS